MVFSKSYCPFASNTKSKLKGAGIAFKAYELDNEADGQAIQNAL